jgi:hypothetical protein
VVKKVKVQLFGHRNKAVLLDSEATKGAVAGVNLLRSDGSVIRDNDMISTTVVTTPTGPVPVTPTLWSLILGMPAFIKNLGNLAGTGLVARTTAGGVAALRSILGTTGRIEVTDGDGVAGDPTIQLGDFPTVKNSIEAGEEYTIPTGHQMLVFEEFIFDGGNLIIDGELVIDGDVPTPNDDPEYFSTVVMESDATKGVKIGDEVANDWGWRDILGQVRQRGVGGNDPTWAAISASVFSSWKFALNDEIWCDYHIPHDYVPGTDIYFHAHWLSDGSDLNTVKWEWTYAYADGFSRQAFDFAAPNTITAEAATMASDDHFLLPDTFDFLLPDAVSLLLLPTMTHGHNITETVAITIPGLEVDGMIYVRLRRITNGGTDNTDGIFLITSDVHYQSNNLATKNKAPDFYT